jgi:hypothetical protein
MFVVQKKKKLIVCVQDTFEKEEINEVIKKESRIDGWMDDHADSNMEGKERCKQR